MISFSLGRYYLSDNDCSFFEAIKYSFDATTMFFKTILSIHIILYLLKLFVIALFGVITYVLYKFLPTNINFLSFVVGIILLFIAILIVAKLNLVRDVTLYKIYKDVNLNKVEDVEKQNKKDFLDTLFD